MSKEEIEKYDDRGNLVYEKFSTGCEIWQEYDKRDNLIHYKDTFRNERWYEYDENNNMIYYKNGHYVEYWKKYDDRGNLIYLRKFNGWSYYEEWTEYNEDNKEICYRDTRYFLIGEYYKYDNGGNQIQITEKEYKEIEFRKKEKEYLSRKKCSRFEIMEI